MTDYVNPQPTSDEIDSLRSMASMAPALGIPAAVTDAIADLLATVDAGEQVRQDQADGVSAAIADAAAGQQAALAAVAAPSAPQLRLVHGGQTLTDDQADDLNELAAFARFAMEHVYPVVEQLRPLGEYIARLGPQLDQASPVELARLLTRRP